VLLIGYTGKTDGQQATCNIPYFTWSFQVCNLVPLAFSTTPLTFVDIFTGFAEFLKSTNIFVVCIDEIAYTVCNANHTNTTNTTGYDALESLLTGFSPTGHIQQGLPIDDVLGPLLYSPTLNCSAA